MDPSAHDADEDDGLDFMQQHGAHGWHQQFGMDVPEKERIGFADRSTSQDMMFGRTSMCCKRLLIYVSVMTCVPQLILAPVREFVACSM